MGIRRAWMESLVTSGMSASLFSCRDTCRACGSRDLAVVLDYGAMPLAGGFFPADDERSRRCFPMTLERCGACTLMQVRETVDPQIIFATYSYTSSVNRTLGAHFAEMANVLHGMARGGLVGEFGCNDGGL